MGITAALHSTARMSSSAISYTSCPLVCRIDLPAIQRGSGASWWEAGASVELSLLSGPPFTANLGSFNNSENGANFPADRPDLNTGIKPCSLSTGNPAAWFNPTGVFTLPPAGEYGNAGRNIMCGPPLKDFDFNVSKKVRLQQRVGLEFRADLFNLFNHPNLNVPVNTAAVGTDRKS